MPGGRPRGGGSTAARNAGIGGEIVTGPRSTRNKRKSYVLESTSSEEDESGEATQQGYDDEDEDEDARVAAGGVSGLRRGAGRKARNSAARSHNNQLDDEPEEDEDDDAEAEADSDGDVEMDDEAAAAPVNPRPGPKILRVNGPAPPKPKVTVTPAAGNGKLQSVESKEIEMAEADANEDDDEELSELDSNEDAEGDEDDEEEEDETMDADAEAIRAMKARDQGNLGEDDEEEEEDEGEDGVEEEDNDDEDDQDQSRASTPDISRMTKRQRSRFDLNGGTESPGPGVNGAGIGADDFLQLPMEPQIKKHLTAEEHAMRRAEMARRRKNLSEKRNEEEKMDTINRLLKKQAPKRRGKISAAEIEAQDRADDMSGQGETGGATEQAEDEEVEIGPANPVFVRWVCNKDGSRIGVPEEWLGTPFGRVFGEKSMPVESGKMVEVVEG